MRASAVTSSLAAEAYTVVRQRIARGELVLGQPVSRRRLAAELGMSFLPVSEALLRLEFEGLLESRPRAGTRVRIPSPEDVEGNYIVRQALEMQAAILCSHIATAAERSELRRLAARVDALSMKPDRSMYVALRVRALRRAERSDRAHARNGDDLVLRDAEAVARRLATAASGSGRGHPQRRRGAPCQSGA